MIDGSFPHFRLFGKHCDSQWWNDISWSHFKRPRKHLQQIIFSVIKSISFLDTLGVYPTLHCTAVQRTEKWCNTYQQAVWIYGHHRFVWITLRSSAIMINTSTWPACSCIVNLATIRGGVGGGRICYTWLEQFRRYHLHHTFLLTIRVCLTSMGLSLSEQMEIMSEAHCSHSLLSLPCFGGQWLVRIPINWKCFTAGKKKLLERQMQDENSVHFVYLRSEPNSTWMWKRKPRSADKSIFVPHSVTSPSQLIAYCMFYSFRVSPLCTRN